MTHTTTINAEAYNKGNWTIPLDQLDTNNVAHLYELHAQGFSYHNMEKVLGVPHSTAHTRVRKYLVERYDDESKDTPFNLMTALREDYLKNPKLSKRQKDEIRQWMRGVHRKLSNTKGVLSYRQERDKCRKETSPLGDWRGDLEAI